MPNTIHKFETFGNAGRHFRKNNITNNAEKMAWIKSEYTTVELSTEQLREYLNHHFPGQNVTVPDDQVPRRAALSEQVRDEYIQMGIERSTVPLHDSIQRQLSVLFRPEVDEASRIHNEKLSKAVDTKDYSTIANMMDEFVENLPSYDVEELIHLSDEEVVRMFRPLYTAYALSQEAKALLSGGDVELKSVRPYYSKATMDKLAQIEKDAGIFAELKLRCDCIADPHYAYIDHNKLLANQSKLLEVVMNPLDFPSRTLLNYAVNLNSGAQVVEINLGRNIQRLLENDGYDLNNTKIRDSFNRDYKNNHKDCRAVLQGGDTLYCTCGDRLKVFALEEGKLVELNPAVALEKTVQRSEAALNSANNLLTGSTADPFWLLTGSSQYRSMKKNMADYLKLKNSKHSQDPEKVSNALEKMEASARAYLEHKHVDLNELTSFAHFKARHLRLLASPNSQTKPLSKHELARIEAAYSMLEVARDTAGTNALRQELTQMPALTEQQVSNEVVQQTAPSRAAQVHQMNQQIQISSFLTDPVAPAGDNHAAENLRQQIQNSLFAPENGLLNKKFFTAQDRQLAETTLAQAVVLNVIRAGRKSMGNPPVPAEDLYQAQPQEMIQEIQQSDMFRNLVGSRISPDGMRRFLLNQNYIGVSKDFIANAAKLGQDEAVPQTQQEHQLGNLRTQNEPIAQPQMHSTLG